MESLNVWQLNMESLNVWQWKNNSQWFSCSSSQFQTSNKPFSITQSHHAFLSDPTGAIEVDIVDEHQGEYWEGCGVEVVFVPHHPHYTMRVFTPLHSLTGATSGLQMNDRMNDWLNDLLSQSTPLRTLVTTNMSGAFGWTFLLDWNWS